MSTTFNPANLRIGIIGLSYVGLPHKVEFARQMTHRAKTDRIPARVGYRRKSSRCQ